MDLSFLTNPDEPSPLEIVHADTKEKIGVTFFVLPESSNAVFSSLAEQREKAFAARADGGNVSADMLRSALVAQYAAMVTGWSSTNDDWANGVGEYSKEKALKLFEAAQHDRSAASIMKQVSDFAASLANFTKPAKKG